MRQFPFWHFWGQNSAGGDRLRSKNGDGGWLEGTGKSFATWRDPPAPQEKTLIVGVHSEYLRCARKDEEVFVLFHCILSVYFTISAPC